MTTIENSATPVRVERATLNSLPLMYQAMAEIWAFTGEVQIVESASPSGGK